MSETSCPLVTCIMPTSRRPEMARDAVRMFRAQTWPYKELVILDDSLTPSFPDGEYQVGLNPGCIFYEQESWRLTIGEKRNICCANAAGQIIMHWDSDDFYAPDRILDQAVRLLENPLLDMTGYHSMEFVDEANQARWMYDAGPGHAIGVSQCYWKRTWQEREFKHIDISEDMDFVAGRSLISAPANRRIIARIHEGNSCNKVNLPHKYPDLWKPLPYSLLTTAT